MKKVIMFTGGNETQEYFTLQLAKAFDEMGHGVFLYRLDKGYEDLHALGEFIEDNNTSMITFNFHGIDMEEPFYVNGKYFWDAFKIPCYNIVLDHPFYFHKYLEAAPSNYVHISIDLGHERYMKRFFPMIKLGPFLPLAGTEILNKPYEERTCDIVMTGNYTPPNHFEQYITRINEDYTEFYYGIIDDLIANPFIGIDEAFEKHLLREMPDLTDDELKLCMSNMIFIDLYVRFYFRGLVVRTLADNDFPVHVYGGGWDLLECRKRENIIDGKPLTSLGCLKVISDSKISLNVMPWFKYGGHDRIANSMLNGALSLSDDSVWLRENFIDQKEIVYYSLSHIEQVPAMVDDLLSNPNKLIEIAQAGYEKAKKDHTWACRAKVLAEII